MAAPARVPKIRAYKDILTPALHKRFAAGTFKVLLPICYLVAIAIGEWNSWLWAWFPLGRASIRTGLLFICALFICILRVSQWHVGVRTTTSPAYTFFRHFFRFETVQTTLYYLLSAWLFCEVFIFSAAKEWNIYWIAQGKIYDRSRLNERAIYLMSYCLSCAIVQTYFHILYDYDRIDICIDHNPDDDQEVTRPPLRKMRDSLWKIFRGCYTKAFAMACMSPFIYMIFVRSMAWKYTLWFAKIFWTLPKTSTLPVAYPFHIWVLWKSLVAGTLLFVLWDFSNRAFSLWVGQPPVKKGNPITDASSDPNGSLLSGLKSRKMLNKAFAFWELQRITRGDPTRRRTIYEEIERKDGATWLQIFTLCSENINIANARMQDYLSPAAASKSDLAFLNNPPRDPPVPFIGTPLKEDLILSGKKGRSSNIYPNLGGIAKSIGSSTSPYNATQALLDKGAKYAPNIDPKKTISWGSIQEFIKIALRSPIGHFFQQTHQRRARAIILGTPYSELDIILCAINSVTRLAVKSLEEDRFGKVQRNIRDIFTVFTTTVENIEAVENKLLSDIHWMDVEFESKDGSDVVPEIELLLKVLRSALQDLIAAFANYSDAMSLDSRVMRKAREAAIDTRKAKKSEAVRLRGGAGTVNPSRSRESGGRQRGQQRSGEKEREREPSRRENREQGEREPEMRQAAPGLTRLPGGFSAATSFEDVFMNEAGRNGRVRASVE